MKKLVLILAMFIPLVVFANVDENTQTTQWEVATTPEASALCRSAETQNNTADLQNGTLGYYLYCIEISCTDNKNVHKIDNPLANVLKCSNGNTNPRVVIDSSGAQDEELKNGAACTSSGVYAYATEKMYYNCTLTSNEESFTPSTTQTPTTTLTPADDETTTTITSPQTGVEDYFLTLGIVTIVLMSALYIIDKKNVFKKI